MSGKLEEEEEEGSYWGVAPRQCDSCRLSPALLFCHPHAAFLCSPCDSRLHAAAPHHPRVCLCQVCEHSPAAFTCRADAAALCPSCDQDIHAANTLARRHHRLPISPFFHTPSSFKHPPAALLDHHHAHDDPSWLLPTLGLFHSTHKSMVDVDPFLDLEYADSVVPAQQSKPTEPLAPMQQPYCHRVSSSDASVVPEVSSDHSAPIPAATAAVGMDRVARVLRYREKRKSRKFEKTIRYASRKAYAETRPRVKGRFAKREETDAVEAPAVVGGGFFSRPQALAMDLAGYGVVPTF